MTRSFVCADCEAEVHVICAPAANDDGDLCADCRFVLTIPDEVQRAEVRKLLGNERPDP